MLRCRPVKRVIGREQISRRDGQNPIALCDDHEIGFVTVTGQILMGVHMLRGLELKLEFVSRFWLLPSPGLGFQFHPGGVLAACLTFGFLYRDALRCLVGSG